MTAGFVGILMTIICCKTLCEFLLELNQPVLSQTPPLRGPRTVEGPTVLEMPIVIRIYMPQQGTGAAAAGAATLPTVTVVPLTATATATAVTKQAIKHAFSPLPTSIAQLNPVA